MTRNTRYRLGALLAPVVLVAIILAGCGGGGGGGLSGSGNTGTLSVSMVDAPDPTITAMNVTIDRVQAHVINPADPNDNDPSHWTTISTAPQSFNLFDLVRNEMILGSQSLPVGHYTQMRLFASSATVTDDTGMHAMMMPGMGNTGIKLNVDYTIGPNQITAILLDFNASKSLIRTGPHSYQMQPVIPCVVKVLSGTITGKVTQVGAPLARASVKAVYTAGDKYPPGTEVNTTFTLADGTFKIWALLPGTYDVAVTAPAGATTTKSGVVVTANQNTDIGTIVVP